MSMGDTVTTGDRLAVVEAMKMESVITAPRDGVIAALHAVSGDQVEAGDLIVEVN
jgi:3-methylcrotonyl-CoA carboxylase alpha subunit